MEISIKELRTQPGRVISMVSLGNSITVTMRGKPAAKIVPLDELPEEQERVDGLQPFGMWKDRKDLSDPAEYVADLRKGRDL